jgi:hypothetical protein
MMTEQLRNVLVIFYNQYAALITILADMIEGL